MGTKKDVVVLAPLTFSLPYDGYGANEKVVQDRVKFLRKEGYNVQFVVNIKDKTIADSVLSPQKVYKYPKNFTDHVTWLLTFKWERYISTYIKLKSKIWEAPILSDAGTFDPINNFLLAKSLGRQRMLYFLSGNFYLTNGRGKSIFQPIDALMKFSRSLNFGSLNQNLNNYLKTLNFKSYYMPAGIDFSTSSSVTEQPEDYFIFIGAINKNKAPHLAIKIAEALNVPLRIVGPIHDPKYFLTFIKPYLNKKVKYMGEVTNDELTQLLKMSRCLLFTSVWNEPQGMVILEAFSYGVPVIAIEPGHYSGVYDMIDHMKTGLIGSFKEILQNSDDILGLNRKSIYNIAKENWSWQNVLKKYHIPVIEKLRENGENEL